MMGWLDRLLGIGEKSVNLADQAVVDKDALLKLAQEGKHEEMTAYVAELQARTFPLGDWIHKMGRQFTNWALLLLAWRSLEIGQNLPAEVWLVLGGSSSLYTVMKGRGK